MVVGINGARTGLDAVASAARIVCAVDQNWFTPQAAAGTPAALTHEVREEYERPLQEAVALIAGRRQRNRLRRWRVHKGRPRHVELGRLPSVWQIRWIRDSRIAPGTLRPIWW